MTVSTEISSNEYTGNGVTTDFDYKFRIFKTNQLSVITSDADGDNVVTLRLGTEYTVTGANKSAGGKVILTKPLANGHKISIARDIPITQETSFRNQGKFLAETHEDAFDYLTMIIQRIWGSLGSLYLKRPNILANWFDAKGYRIANLGKPKRDTDAVDLGTLKDEIEGVNSTILKKEKRTLRVDDVDIAALPKSNERAGNVLTFDKDGNPIVVAPATGSAIDVLNQLASNSGASLIGTGSGKTVEESITGINENIAITNKNIVTNIIPAIKPTVTNSIKAIVKITDSVDDFYVISKKAQGKSGFIAVRITNAVSASDASNYGGSSPLRPSSVDNLNVAKYGKLKVESKSESVVISSLTASQIERLYGYALTGSEIHSSSDSDFNLKERNAYTLPTSASVIYKLSARKAIVRLGASGTTSEAVKIWISREPTGSNWTLVNEVATNVYPAGAPEPIDIEVNGLSNTNWYLKVENATKTSSLCYLVGLNLLDIGGTDIYDYDCFIAVPKPWVGGQPSYYFGGLGATEFAAKELSTGKFFGTYHGAHSDFLQRLRTDNASYNLDTRKAPDLFLTSHCLLHTTSKITLSNSVYQYVSSTEIGDGVTATSFSLKLLSGQPVLCERSYTHMATTARNFDWIHFPVLLNKTDDGDVKVGQTGFIQQYRATDAATVNCYFSQINVSDNGNKGAYISFQPNYNKQYYGAIFSSAIGAELNDGVYTTHKEFI
ncbi:hypothetical protein [Providencia sp. PROV147]|uniref:hypothetical protein n=1 Tax=Providencia sp. PROV147 TaxID=2949857 RepID=UPI00234A1530|nr:hypothetical protein [Providencia sp. PROV147]